MKHNTQNTQREFWRQRFFILLASLLCCCSMYAQDVAQNSGNVADQVELTGKVIDKETNEPIVVFP